MKPQAAPREEKRSQIILSKLLLNQKNNNKGDNYILHSTERKNNYHVLHAE